MRLPRGKSGPGPIYVFLGRFLPLIALAGCNAMLVYDPQQPVAPNPLDRTEPDLELRVYYSANSYDSVVKPKGTFFFAPLRCIYVSNPFRVMVIGSDLESGVSFLRVGSPDVRPLANTIVASPAPDSATQADDPASPNITYANPGGPPGSHTADVTYYTGGTPPGRPRGLATLTADFDLAGAGHARITASVQNTSVSTFRSSVDGYFVRTADPQHPAGSACTPPP